MEFNTPKPKNKTNWNSHLSTILGAIVAVANAWMTIDWETFEPDSKHLFPLFISAAIALGGYMTSINTKAK